MKINLWQLFRSVKFYIVLSLIIGFFCNMSVIGLMAASAYLVTSAALKIPLYKLALAITGVRACGIFRAVFRYAERYISHNAAFTVWQQLRKNIYRNVIRALPFSEKAMHDGDIFTAVISSLEDLRDAVLRLFLPPFTALFMVLALFLFIYPYSVYAAKIFLTAFFVTAILLPLIFYPYKQKKMVSFEAELLEFLEGAKDMAAFGYQNERKKTAYNKINNNVVVENSSFRFSMLAAVSARITTAVTIVAVLAAFIVSPAQITAIDAAVIILAVTAAFEVMLPLSELGSQFRKAADAVEKLDYLLQPHNMKLPYAVESRPKNEDILTVSNVSFGYEKDKLIYDAVNFSLEKGSKTALIGSSGSGKSTMVNLLVKLLAYNAGTIFFQNDAYNYIDEVKLRENIKTAMQNQYIFTMTIRENFHMLYPKISDMEIYKALKLAGLYDFVIKTPQKLDTQTGRDGAFLSGGQRKRLAIAVALAKDAPMLILDEPTAGLDIFTAKKIMNTVLQLDKEHTVLVITHDLSCITKFDKIFVLDKGKIIESGTPMELLQKKEHFANMMQYRRVI
ncbi:thiol reductant ABC exporter subunit CydC [Pectinatus sottacetonis]|uniref:thiol reductant ABC exporter subunit CydC n=1 Tax=Pectinatus sottacetonis TaxID=1002795 RepID=UPI0018C6FE6C|nr:thiol reductant ABC exporter subunit CydC [Pectinatus sottacetonis]